MQTKISKWYYSWEVHTAPFPCVGVTEVNSCKLSNILVSCSVLAFCMASFTWMKTRHLTCHCHLLLVIDEWPACIGVGNPVATGRLLALVMGRNTGSGYVDSEVSCWLRSGWDSLSDIGAKVCLCRVDDYFLNLQNGDRISVFLPGCRGVFLPGCSSAILYTVHFCAWVWLRSEKYRSISV